MMNSRRLFSTAAKVVIPKKLHGIPGRYAEAVYVAASKANLLDTVDAELTAFKASMVKSPPFAKFLGNPTLSRKEKVSMIGGLLEENKISHITRNLFLVMAANGRIGEAGKVIDSYIDLMQTAKGVVKCVIISAEPLKAASQKAVEAAMTKIAGEGKKLDIKVEINPKILGGLQVIVGDKFVDLAVSSRLNDLTKTLQTTSL